jgi:hypothetical protein
MMFLSSTQPTEVPMLHDLLGAGGELWRSDYRFKSLVITGLAAGLMHLLVGGSSGGAPQQAAPASSGSTPSWASVPGNTGGSNPNLNLTAPWGAGAPSGQGAAPQSGTSGQIPAAGQVPAASGQAASPAAPSVQIYAPPPLPSSAATGVPGLAPAQSPVTVRRDFNPTTLEEQRGPIGARGSVEDIFESDKTETK